MIVCVVSGRLPVVFRTLVVPDTTEDTFGTKAVTLGGKPKIDSSFGLAQQCTEWPRRRAWNVVGLIGGPGGFPDGLGLAA